MICSEPSTLLEDSLPEGKMSVNKRAYQGTYTNWISAKESDQLWETTPKLYIKTLDLPLEHQCIYGGI